MYVMKIKNKIRNKFRFYLTGRLKLGKNWYAYLKGPSVKCVLWFKAGQTNF